MLICSDIQNVCAFLVYLCDLLAIVQRASLNHLTKSMNCDYMPCG